jgi:hypothetical protein
MSRRTMIATLTGTLLLGVLGAPALAHPVSTERETVCVRTDNGESAQRKGICVWVPVPLGER